MREGEAMLRTLFFVLSWLTDYRAIAQAMQTGLVLGAVNTGVFAALAGSAYLHRLVGRSADKKTSAPRTKPEVSGSRQNTRSLIQRATAFRPACTRSTECASVHHCASWF